MRTLTLDEKISIKGQLARKGVLPRVLATLNMRVALNLFWICYGRPASTHSSPKQWRKSYYRRPVTKH